MYRSRRNMTVWIKCSYHSLFLHIIFYFLFSLFCVSIFSFLWEDERPVISTGMVFPSTIMKILSQGRWTSSQVSSPTTFCSHEAPYTNACWTVSGEMVWFQLAVLHVYSVFCNHNRRDLVKALLILNNHYFRDSRDYCTSKKCTSKSTSPRGLYSPSIISSCHFKSDLDTKLCPSAFSACNTFLVLGSPSKASVCLQ